MYVCKDNKNIYKKNMYVPHNYVACLEIVFSGL